MLRRMAALASLILAAVAPVRAQDGAKPQAPPQPTREFEIREDRIEAVSAAIRERMAGAAELSVPLVVDLGVGANWDEAH